ncbi:prenyltransferase/squalene oxidase repeat-containing protein [Novipirellula artificiosorum]|uniref:Squalene cyclase C-terminal domain-containing protein n=1 Tax=Novipirellula artificiosorum TaxID=2528016 RepID=A0A5C6DV74_9BACT|nr:prenyltransferase/squalene oxidase repeat-containing protein [Novipirellula artificiosorum]TWU40502.1 hypothetical protein Poly41_13350 [Novipirellula artificiosorum]
MATVTEPILATLVADEDARVESHPSDDDYAPQQRFLLFRVMPAWMISMFVHVIILLVLGLITVGTPAKVVNVLSARGTGEEGPEMEEFAIEPMDPGDLAEMEEVVDQTVEVAEQMDMVEPEAVAPLQIEAVTINMNDLAAEMAPVAASLQTLAGSAAAPMSSRSNEMKKKLLRDYGGNASSESAVGDALKWLSLHQMPNGAWTFQHNRVCRNRCGDPGESDRADAHIAATSLALLPFLGAGQTHMYGEYKDRIRAGLLFLATSGKSGKQQGMPVLDLRESGGNMYSHGLAAITLSEAYAMTGDTALAGPAQAALNYIVYAQGRDGGWRYQPKAPNGGDTSVTGWQVMALKSGHMGHLVIPPTAVQGSILFLNKVQSEDGAKYGYDTKPTKSHEGCTAMGLLCRMYTGWDKDHPGIIGGVKELTRMGVKKDDIYYDYYAAQVLRHYGGLEWDKFNVELRDWLVNAQSQAPGAKGSWHFPNSHSHRGPREGGRLASTAFATMILEVYYRHMPLYADTAAEDDFPL